MENHRLINIYIKIHNKKNITMDDLRYLAQYDPECFRKTCANVVYNIPETKEVMDGAVMSDSLLAETLQTDSEETKAIGETKEFDLQAILENIKKMEDGNVFYKNVDSKRVKNLLGNLFMELLFPHNCKDAFIFEDVGEVEPKFDIKA